MESTVLGLLGVFKLFSLGLIDSSNWLKRLICLEFFQLLSFSVEPIEIILTETHFRDMFASFTCRNGGIETHLYF